MTLVHLPFVALAVYIRSPAAYQMLQRLKLPSKSTLQSYLGAFIHEPGASTACIADQVSRFVAYKSKCLKLGKQEPKADI